MPAGNLVVADNHRTTNHTWKFGGARVATAPSLPASENEVGGTEVVDVQAGERHVAAADAAERQPVAAAGGNKGLQSRQVEGKRAQIDVVAAGGEVSDHVARRAAVLSEDERVITAAASHLIRSGSANEGIADSTADQRVVPDAAVEQAAERDAVRIADQ